MESYAWIGLAAVVLLALFFIWSFFIRVDPRVVNQISSDSAGYRKTRLPLDADTQKYLGNDDLDATQRGPRN